MYAQAFPAGVLRRTWVITCLIGGPRAPAAERAAES
jgi:hypothetical protein